ncbi:MAG: C40 family peptidase [Desulfamplus sp.]|nr:C40 family peptidase [Desulfamplus sp.]
MNRFILSIAVIFLCFSMTACSSVVDKKIPEESRIPEERKIFSHHDTRHDSIDDMRAVKEDLYDQFHQWEGVKYRLGGLNRNGIDCSGFVYVTYLEKFGIDLPRNTDLQVRIGRYVRFNDLRSGDLVFFKIGWKGKHVGIYIEDNMFLHVSTRKGVMISSLHDRYWSSKYWQARRIDL